MKNLTILFILIFSLGCKETTKKEASSPIIHYEIRDYVIVGQMFDTIKTPYIIDLKNGNKRVVFIGCEHQMPDTHPQFKTIETYFNALKPQITFNEGGQWADSIHFKTIGAAIKRGGESAILKYFSDSIGIKIMNGDMSDSLQFAYSSRYHTQEEWYLYYMIERCIIPYFYSKNKNETLDSVFSKDAKGYFTKNGFKMTPEQMTLTHFKTVYKKYMKKDFERDNFDLEAFDYVNPNCHFCAIGRTSKIVRDSVLLTKIDKALDSFDRVMVTFGHGHALAVEPALRQIINRKR